MDGRKYSIGRGDWGRHSWRFDGDYCVGCIAGIFDARAEDSCMHCPGACLLFCMREQ